MIKKARKVGRNLPIFVWHYYWPVKRKTGKFHQIFWIIFRSDFRVNWKNQNKHSTLNSTLCPNDMNQTLACFICFCAAFHRHFCSEGYRNFCSEAHRNFCMYTTEISVPHTTEISVKSSAKAEETSYYVLKIVKNWNL